MFKGISCDSVKVEIHLDGKYPFQAPRVILTTKLPFPSLADGRNLLDWIIKKPWAEDITVLEIANLFPQFLSENHNNPSAGKFHLGQCMNLGFWDTQPGMKVFICQEIDPQNQKFFKDRALVVSHSMILELETNPQYPGQGHLICYASLFSLNTIKVAKSDNQKVTFEWKISENDIPLAQQFKIPNFSEFIALALENTEKLGVSIDRKIIRPISSISEEDVNSQALQKIKIKEITEGIIQHEVSIQDEISKDKINQLIELYQKAIEYYSAVNDQKFHIYLEKVRKLLSDEIMLDVLAGKPPPKKNETKTLDDNKVKMFEDLEVWPSGPPEKNDIAQDVELSPREKAQELRKAQEELEESKEDNEDQEKTLEIKLAEAEELPEAEENLEESKEDNEDQEKLLGTKEDIPVHDHKQEIEEIHKSEDDWEVTKENTKNLYDEDQEKLLKIKEDPLIHDHNQDELREEPETSDIENKDLKF
jgi:hypothetical protein